MDFLNAHADTEVVLTVGELHTRVKAANHYPVLADFDEGPYLMRAGADVQRAVVSVASEARAQGVSAVNVNFGEVNAVLSAVDLPHIEEDGEAGESDMLFLMHPTASLVEPQQKHYEVREDAFRVITDHRAVVLWAEPAFFTAFGLDPEQVSTYTLVELAVDATQAELRRALKSQGGDAGPSDRKPMIDQWMRALQLGMSTGRARFRDAEGNPGKWYQVTLRVLDDTVEILFVDVTQDVLNGHRVQNSMEDLQRLAETVPLGIFRSSPTGDILAGGSGLVA